MKKLFFATFLILLFNQAVLAQDAVDAENMIKNTMDGVLLILGQTDMARQDKSEKISDMVTPMFDFPIMTKLTLGKNHWNDLNEDQKQQFTDLFVKRLKSSYTEKLMMYTDEQVDYEGCTENASKLNVKTALLSKGNKISIIYKLFRSDGKWKIYDVEINGVSIIQSYRSQFSYLLQNGTIEDVFLKLEAPEDPPQIPTTSSENPN